MTDPVRSVVPLSTLPEALGELETLLDRFAVSESGRALLRDAFTTDLKRRVGGGSRNTPVRFPSPKMGCVIQCESRTVELTLLQLAGRAGCQRG